MTVKYFDLGGHSGARSATPGSRSTSCFKPGRSTTPTLAGSSCRCSRCERSADRQQLAQLRRSDDQPAHRRRRPDSPARRVERPWAELDADLMRDNPPWAPFLHTGTTHARFPQCRVLLRPSRLPGRPCGDLQEMTRRPLTLARTARRRGSAGRRLGVGNSAGTNEARKGGTLRMASFEDVGPLDTALGYAPIPWSISFATCAKLFNHPDEAGTSGTRIIQEVVQSYTVSRDGRTYDFELRRTFRFHTGVRVTAQASPPPSIATPTRHRRQPTPRASSVRSRAPRR